MQWCGQSERSHKRRKDPDVMEKKEGKDSGWSSQPRICLEVVYTNSNAILMGILHKLRKGHYLFNL